MPYYYDFTQISFPILFFCFFFKFRFFHLVKVWWRTSSRVGEKVRDCKCWVVIWIDPLKTPIMFRIGLTVCPLCVLLTILILNPLNYCLWCLCLCVCVCVWVDVRWAWLNEIVGVTIIGVGSGGTWHTSRVMMMLMVGVHEIVVVRGQRGLHSVRITRTR